MPTTTTTLGDRDSGDAKRASTASKELILNNSNTHARAHDEEAGSGSTGPGPGGNPSLAIRVTTEYTLAHEAGARRLQ